MKDYLSIPNWDELQHYKDRTPPWIKLHNQLLEDYEFESLPDAAKGHLLCIMLLASRTSNKINPDPKWIGRKIGANSKVDIDLLIQSGFIQLNQQVQTPEHDASIVLQTPEHDAIPEENRVEENRVEEKTIVNKSTNLVFEIFTYWCTVMKKNTSSTKLTTKRDKAIKARLKEYTAEQIKQAIDGCRNDPFSMGQNNRQKPFNDIELICRNGEKLESFMCNLIPSQQYTNDINAISNDFSAPEGWNND